nr:Ig-like domain-containing protein [Caldimonas mangrovi]
MDITAPSLTVDAPALTNDSTPSITGTTDLPNGTTVTLTITDSAGATQTLTATVTGGAYSVTVPVALAEGGFTVVASAADAAGNTATANDAGSLDVTAPSLTIDAPALTNDSTPTITGTTNLPNGATVTLTVTDSAGATQTLTATVTGGAYSVTVPVALAEGGFTVVASAADAAGNTATANDAGSLDITAPSLTVDAPALTNDSTPTITGTTDLPDNSTVTITVTDSAGATQTLTATVTGGAYSVTVPVALAEGGFTVVASAADAAGNTATANDAGSLDVTAPSLTVDAPALTNNSTPTITGTTDLQNGATVTLTVTDSAGATQTFTATVAGGAYSVTVPVALAEGGFTVVASAADAAGNTATANDAGSLDITAPSLTVDAPALTNDSTPTITGTTDLPNGATVTLTVTDSAGATQTLTATVTGGAYSVTVPVALAEGGFTVVASAADAAGNTVTANDAGSLDVTAPSLTVDAPALTNDSTPTITGTTDLPNGATVSLTVTDSAGATQTLTATVAGGAYSVAVPVALAEGGFTVVASAADAAGNTVTANDAGSLDVTAPSLTVDAPALTNDSTPTITGTTDLPNGATVTLTVTDSAGATQTLTATVTGGAYSVTVPVALAEGGFTVVASAADAVGNTATANDAGSLDITAPSLTVDAPALTNDSTPTITGTTDLPNGATVTLTVTDSAGATQTLTATVTGGAYSVAVPAALAEGGFTVVASAADAAGNTATANDAGSLDITAPSLTVDAPALTNDSTPTITGTTDLPNGATVTLTVTDSAGATQTLTATVTGGAYSVAVPAALAEGGFTVVASAADAAGNTATANDAGSLDITAPSLTVDAPALTNDSTPTITGTTSLPNGATITLTVTDSAGATQTLTATVTGGAYSVTVPVALAEGGFTVVASATDAAGNTATANDAGSLDVTAPSLTVDAPALTNDSTPTITGTTNLPNNSTVTLTVTDSAGATQTLTATVTGGAYSVAVPVALAEGGFTVVASAADAAGNTATANDAGSLDVTITASIALDANITSDDVIDAVESSGTVAITGSVGGDVRAGDTVTLTINGGTYTGNVQAGGTFSVDVPGSALAADADRTIVASVSTTDAAGNTTTATDTESYTVNAAPSVLDLDGSAAGTGYATTFTENGAAVSIADTDATLVDTDSATLTGATITLTNAQAGDVLAAGSMPPGITASVSGNTVTLTGSASPAAYASAIRAVTFANTSENPSTTARTIEVVVNDGHNPSNTATTTISVVSVNDAPTAAADTGAVLEDATLTRDAASGVLANDSDNDGGTLSVSAIAFGATAGSIGSALAGQYGSLTLQANGSYTYVANNANELAAGVTANDVFTYTASDGQGGFTTQTLTITITGTNDGPVAVNDSATTPEDTPVVLHVRGNDIDVDGNALSITHIAGTAVSPGETVTLAQGTVTLNANGTLTFAPNSNYAGPANFSYTVSDGVASSTGSVSLTVTPVNDAPVAVNDGPIQLSGLRGEYFAFHEGVDGGSLSTLTQVQNFIAAHPADAIFVASSLNYGTVSGDLGSNNTLQSFLGSDAASLNVDPQNSSDAIIRITGTVQLDAGTYNFRVRSDDGYSIMVDGVVVAQVANNQSPTQTVHSSFIVDTSGSHTIQIIYWDQGGQAVFQPEIRSGTGPYQSLGSTPLSHQAYTTSEDTALVISTGSLLANDTDLDGDALSVLSVQNPVNGTVALVDGQVVFTPTANYHGPASFTYTISDGNGGTNTATVNLTVASVNDRPTTTNVSASGNEDTLVIVTLAGSDIDGTVTQHVIGNLPANGTLYLDAAGTQPVAAGDVVTGSTVYFRPNSNWNGSTSFQYSARDNEGGTSAAAGTATITVDAVNDAPVAGNDAVGGSEDAVITIPVSTLLANDTDIDSPTLTITSVQGAVNGTVSLSGGNVLFTPNANYSGPASFTYTVSDGAAGTSTATVNINVAAAVDAPFLAVPSQLISIVPGPVTISTTAEISQANIESIAGLASGTLDGFNPAPKTSGPGQTNDPGNVDVQDGSVSNYSYSMSAGHSVQFNWAFTNAENDRNEINNGYNDLVVLTITAPDGSKQNVLITSSEQAGVGLNSNGAYTFNAPSAGDYQFSWMVLNGADTGKDSTLAINSINYTVGATSYGTPIDFPLHAGLADTDGSETLSLITVSGVPTNAMFTSGTNLGGGVWTFTPAQAADVDFLPASGYSGTLNLSVSVTSTETGTGATSTSTQAVAVTVGATTNNILGDQGAGTHNGTSAADFIQGLGGNDTINAGSGNDLVHGGDGNDTVNGGDGNDVLHGNAGNDTINGGAGHDQLNGGGGTDVLIGGAGNDVLTGGFGADTFRWQLADRGTTATPAHDTITDFDNSAAGDVLDLRDLLVGESTAQLSNYLHFDKVGDSTVVQISSTGGFSGGTYNPTAVDQRITVVGVDLVGSFSNDQQVIQDLLSRGKLLSD